MIPDDHHPAPPAPPRGWQPAPPREPDSFNGFSPAGGAPTPGGTPPGQGGGYRSLRDAAADPSAGRGRGAAAAGGNTQLAEVLRDLGGPAQAESPRRSTRRRLTVLGVVVVAAVLVLGVGGYAGYHLLSPYYGWGYKAGGSTTVDKVRVTVTEVHCGLDDAPFGYSGTPTGAFCGVTVTAENTTSATRFTELHDWLAQLDVDLRIRPVADYLENRRYPLEMGNKHTFQLVYDIPSGSRMQKLRPSVSTLTKEGVTGSIAVS